jgi:NAD(P)-dependent dehydrogenase (short-subunit alcohol dehydrogenase family)
MFKEYDLAGKSAIVTGAGSGIGREIALTLAEGGVNVAVTGRTRERLEETASLVQDLGSRALVVPADVTRGDQVQTVVERTLSEFGKIDILVNNAGTEVLKPVAHIPGMKLECWQLAHDCDTPLSEEEWHRVIDTNLTSVFLFAQAAGPYMLRRRYGKVINMSSNVAGIAPPYFSAYCTSKAALVMFTRCLASEWGPYNINVNAIAPGGVYTALTAHALDDPANTQELLKRVPLGRMGQTRDVALLVAYLASEASKNITGQMCVTDGGQLSRGNGF